MLIASDATGLYLWSGCRPVNKESAMRGRVLFISNIAWDFVWQRHQTMATLFARDYEVGFLEVPGLRQIGWHDVGRIVRRAVSLLRRKSAASIPVSSVTLLRPWILPMTNSLALAWNRWVLARTLRDWRTGVDVVVNYSPTFTAFAALDLVPHIALIYDCTDNWSAVSGVPSSVLRAEREWLRRADLTLVPSRMLEALHRSHAQCLKRLSHGVLVERFSSVAEMPVPTGPTTLLYYGHLHRQHLDFEMIAALGRLRPDWRIILVGPVKTPGEFPANVQLVGQQNHEALAGWIAHSHVLLLPYVINAYTEAVLPAKTYECLATGRPIVAAPLPDLVAGFTDYMRFARTAEEYAREVELSLAEDTQAARGKRMELARENSWESRYILLTEWLGPFLLKKRVEGL